MTRDELGVREGDFVRWVSGGVIQWKDSRRLVRLEWLAGEWWGFCDGSLTAIKATDLEPESLTRRTCR